MQVPVLVKEILKECMPEDKYLNLQNKYRIKVHNSKEKKKEKRREKINISKSSQFHEDFRVIMEEKKLYVSGDKTITPKNISILSNGGTDGVVCDLLFPKGLSLKDLSKATNELAQNVYGKCMVFIEDEPNKPVRFSAIKDWHNVPYVPLVVNKGNKLTASQLFVGYNIVMEPVVIDLAENPHLLITGGSGGGKLL